jgi:predicted RNase H-like nuclease (RuvC/YqgF family)
MVTTPQEVVNGGAIVMLLTLLGLLGRGAWNMIARRDQREEAAQTRKDKLADHASGLALELLKMTKAEASSLRQEVAELRDELETKNSLERRIQHFEEALFHIEQLLDGAGREGAEHNARLFMAKMVALRQVKGNAANRTQVERASQKLIEDGGDK